MKIALVGAELEENLGLRYIASSLEKNKHQMEIIPYNSGDDLSQALSQLKAFSPKITGLSMVFTNRGREFCNFASALREAGYHGHIIAGGHFASFNCKQLLKDFPAFDSIALYEGEGLMVKLAKNLDNLDQVAGLAYRSSSGEVIINPSTGNPDDLDKYPFPKRTTFHSYFDKSIASILTSRGCWRNCAFCSINAWYKKGNGKKFRYRSVKNIIAEMRELYFKHGIRIFNIQDDNFFLPKHDVAFQRFSELRDGLQELGIEGIAIAVKARPDSITYDLIEILDDLGIFRVFLGVENASEKALKNLNRKCNFDQILNALQILNDFDIHIAYNLLMFEPDTTLDDILINLRFMERHMENPFNFCRAEAYAGTGLESKLINEGLLLGDYFGFDYRLKNPGPEAFHQIANFAFFDRNFSDSGLHYFNMQVDFYFQLLRRLYPEVLTQTIRGEVRSFIKQTNIGTYQNLCKIYDFVNGTDHDDSFLIRNFAKNMRIIVDENSSELRVVGEQLLQKLNNVYEQHDLKIGTSDQMLMGMHQPFLGCKPLRYYGSNSLNELDFVSSGTEVNNNESLLGPTSTAIPYHIFKRQYLESMNEHD
jgi:radical SAM superfamily enzyme YgiQ (UPF0313 family)